MNFEVDSLPKKLIIGYKNSPPFIYKNSDDRIQGLSVYLAQELALYLKRPIEFRAYQLTELLDAVENAEVDLSVNPITVTEDRIKKLDFSQPFAISNLAVLIRKEKDTQMLLFLQNIFSFNFLKVILLLFIVIQAFGVLVWFFEHRKNPEFENSLKGIFSSFWFCAVTMTTVGYGDKAPKTIGGKITTLIWMFSALILISGFTASIAASLTVDKLDDQIKSLNDLKRISVGTVENSSSDYFLIRKGVGRLGFKSIKEGVEALNKGDIESFVYDEPLLRYCLKEHQLENDLKILNFKFDTQYYSFSFPKGSPLVNQVNPELIKLINGEVWQDKIAIYGMGSTK